MNRLLVESATHPAAVAALHDELGDAWRNFENKVYAAGLAKTQAAGYAMLDHRTPFAELTFPSDDESIRTRLGGEGARLVFAAPQPGPFGQPIDEVILPAHWPAHIPVDEVPKCMICDGGRLVITTSKEQYVYDRFGLRRGSANEFIDQIAFHH